MIIDVFKKIVDMKIKNNEFYKFIDETVFDEKKMKNELIKKHFNKNKTHHLIQEMEEYLKKAPNMDQALKTDFLDIFKSVMINKSNNTFLYGKPIENYTSDLKEEFAKINDLISENTEMDDKNISFSMKINNIFSLLYRNLILKFFNQPIEIFTARGCILNPTILKLIDDSMIKLQYDLIFIIFLSEILRNKIDRNFSAQRIFVQKNKMFVERYEKFLSENAGKMIFDPATLEDGMKSAMIKFELSENVTTITSVKQTFTEKINVLSKIEDLKNFGLLVILRMKILNHIILHIKATSKLKYNPVGFSTRNNDDLPYMLLLTFLDLEKILEN